MKNSTSNTLLHRGFSLVEMAVVLVIFALLLSGGMTIFANQQEMRKVQETKDMLENAKEALLGFAAANGRLPCPASAASSGRESFCTNDGSIVACGATIVPPAAIPAHGRCSNPYTGFLPAVTLGITPIDSTGYALDAFATPNSQIRYAVSNYYNAGNNIHPFTSINGISTVTMQALNAATAPNPAPELYVCASSIGIAATTCGIATSLTTNAVAVIYSVGENATVGGTSADEAANPNVNSANDDPVFVSHAPSFTNVRDAIDAPFEFDDQLTWLSPNILYNRMISAGRLP